VINLKAAKSLGLEVPTNLIVCSREDQFAISITVTAATVVDPCGVKIYDFLVAKAKQTSVSATEETGAIPIQPDQTVVGEPKASARSFLQAARRNLTEQEASSPAGIRWLTHDVERLDQECSSLRAQVEELQARYDELNAQYNGLTIGPDHQILVGCNGSSTYSVIIYDDGRLPLYVKMTTGVDEVWFDPGSNHYYLAQAGAAIMGVEDAGHGKTLPSPDPDAITQTGNSKNPAGAPTTTLSICPWWPSPNPA
jgi:hypothetical protein